MDRVKDKRAEETEYLNSSRSRQNPGATYSCIHFFQLNKRIIEDYSRPDSYSIADTSSGNVYVCKEPCEKFKSNRLNGDLKMKLKLIITSVNENHIEASEIKNGTPSRVPLTRLGNPPKSEDNISREETCGDTGGEACPTS